jgi:hypothetical protein
MHCTNFLLSVGVVTKCPAPLWYDKWTFCAWLLKGLWQRLFYYPYILLCVRLHSLSEVYLTYTTFRELFLFLSSGDWLSLLNLPSTLDTEAAGFSETSGTTSMTTQCRNPDHSLNFYRHENLKSRVSKMVEMKCGPYIFYLSHVWLFLNPTSSPRLESKTVFGFVTLVPVISSPKRRHFALAPFFCRA